MNYQKPYLTSDQKLQLLKDKGLKISNEAFASEFIQQVGFSRFLSFSEAFMDKSERFVSKTDFYKIVSIYRLEQFGRMPFQSDTELWAILNPKISITLLFGWLIFKN